MAIIKHIAMKIAKYSSAIDYLTYQHDEYTQKMITDEYGIPVLRDDYLLEGINCDPYSYDYECYETNHTFNKNQSRDEIKQHHYIISFDPKDSVECGLTCEKAQSMGMEYAKKNFPGHQMLVCTHPDGHNASGNIHVHIIMNSVRKLDVDMRDFMERDIDSRAGYKHHVTKDYLRYLKSDLMELCRREQLHQVDLLRRAPKKVTDREYYAARRTMRNRHTSTINRKPVAYPAMNDRGEYVPKTGNHTEVNMGITSQSAPRQGNGIHRTPTKYETQKQFLRRAIDDCVKDATDEEAFRSLLLEKYNITLKISRGRYSYLHPERSKYIRGRMLGTDYEAEHLKEVFKNNEVAIRDVISEDNPTELPPILTQHSDLRLVTDLQRCAKAMASKAYARKVRLSNLQRLAQTVAFVQEQGFDSIADLDKALSEAEKRMQSSRAVLDETKKQLKSVNEQIHFTGQYLSTKKINAAYRKSRDKAGFKVQYANDLARYKEAVHYLKEHNRDGKIPSIVTLKDRKKALTEKREYRYKRYSSDIDTYRQLKVIKQNIDSLLGDADSSRNRLSHSQPSSAHPARRPSR